MAAGKSSSSSSSRSMGTSFSTEHGPFAGRAGTGKMYVKPSEARDGMIAFHKGKR